MCFVLLGLVELVFGASAGSVSDAHKTFVQHCIKNYASIKGLL